MKTFTNCAEKKAKQFLNLLQGYTKGIRIIAVLTLLLTMGVSNAWGAWIGNTGISVNDVWYKSSSNIDSGNWLESCTSFNNANLGAITSLVLGGQYETWDDGKTDYCNWNDNNGIHITIKKESTQRASFKLSCYHKEKKGNNNVWETSGGINGCSDSGTWGTYTVNISEYAPETYTINAKWFSPSGKTLNNTASFTINPVVTFNNNGGSGSMDKQTVTYNTNTALSANKFTRTNYTFSGWNTKANGSGTSYADKANVKLTANTTLYAQWTPAQYTITYKDQGNATFSGTHDSDYPTTHTYGTATTLKTASKTGYTFDGWFTTQDCSGSAVTTLGATAYTAAITLYAKWTAIRCNITLTRGDGASGGSEYVYATYGSNILEPKIENPTKTGYNFLGWSNQGGNVIVIDTNGKLLPSKSNGSLIKYTDAYGNWAHTGTSSGLWAQWEAAKYNINYKDQGNADFSGTHASGYPTQHTYGKVTTLSTASKTGYTFEGWYKEAACTNKVTSLAANTYSANITLYAKWTIKQYTLDFGAGEGGSVTATVGGKEISSPATLPYNTSVTLTATPEGENAFAQWVNGSGVKVSTNPYTFTLTGDKTLKAEFSKPTTVYLKPSDAWKEYNAHFAIYAWGGKSGDPWVEMEAVDCEGDYYKANVPAGFSDFAFVRLKEGGEHDWANKLNQTGNLTVQTNGKNMYDVEDKTKTYIHLEAKAWDNGEARFAAYFFGNGDKWVNLTKNGDVYSCKKPEGYTSVIFCRMIKNNADNNFNNCWNKTKDLSLMDNGDNCFWIDTDNSWGCAGDVPGDEANDGDGDRDGADGGWYRLLDDSQWKTYSAPTYNVTIKPTIHGTYSVICNGRTYLAPNKEEIVIPNVPVGTTLTIQDVTPNNETEYTSDIIYKESANAEYQTLEGNQITVCGNTTIDENFVTRNPHVVYFRVPTSLATSWNANGTTNFVYSYNDIKIGKTGYVTTMVADNSIQDAQYTYYHCTIPAGCHTFRFERKNNANESAQQKTVSFTHAMPFNGMNCFTITNSGDEYTGYWDVLLTNGDYRLLYVEQVVEKSNVNGNEWKTVVTRKKAHPSDIIKKGVESQIVSLHIYKERKYTANAGGGKTYESSSNPEIILQQYSNGVWVDKESHMVFGPLETLPGMAMAPGRRNAAADGKLVYDDGIEIIKNDQHPDESNGVWNFTVTQSNGGESATIDLTQTRRYNEETDGPYYIRTDVANGNWYNYTNPDNHMTRSDVSKQHSNYSHYFCKWVESTDNVNVKFTIANKYGYAISDTLEADETDLWGVELNDEQKMVKGQVLPKNANVRFTWNEKSNLIHRAYIAGSANVQDRFLVLRGKGDSKLFNAAGEALTEGQAQTPRYGLHANEEIFSDIENWVYQTDVQMIPGAELQVTADYNEKVQYFVGKEGIFNNTILQGSGTEKYLVRLLYDFKTNELISAYVPGASKDVDQISTNLMLIRQNYGEAKQLVFNNGDMSTRDNRKAYGVIEFTENYLTNVEIQYLKRCLYWVSFPFDVNLSETFGSLVYGKHWLIQEYDGARRAAEGLWKESESFWKLHWEPNITLKAGLGYVIEIDINQMIKDNIIDTKDAKQQIAALYFPSNTPITREIINQKSYTVNIPAHKCEIVHTGTYGDRTIRDSHWNVIGVPSYVNTGATFSDTTYALNEVVKYYYQWQGEVDKYTAMEAKEQAYDFQSMYAYMVQYAGDITWNSVLLDEKPAQIAAKKNSVTNEHAMRLELQQNNILLDKTFVRLQDDVATHAFDFNYDLCKITNKGANIYSIITAEASPVDVAANVLPIEETIIPIGIKTDASGEYTFAMPDGTDGIVVELIDYETNTRTNMLLSDYTVSLPKGTNETRFALHLKPSKVVTGLENIGNSVNGLNGKTVKKYLIDGVLYLQKGNLLYDAQGRCVK